MFLRPTSRDGEYLFLGECYVYGMMDGEAMTMLESGEAIVEWVYLV